MKISVCIPSYNGESYIEAQVRSILEQLSSHDEVIISDDSSKDRTVDIIKEFSDSRIILLEDNHFRSPIYNVENAIKRATGDIIILADQDDVWLPNRVELMVRELIDCDLVFTDAYIVDEVLNHTGKTVFEVLKPSKRFISNLIKNSFVGCCIAFNKNLKDAVLPFPKMLPMHDQWIGLVACLNYSVNLVNEPTLLYRRHDSNMSNTGGKSSNDLLTKLKFRLRILYALSNYIWKSNK